MFYFSVIGNNDTPLYELEFASFKSVGGVGQFPPNVRELLPFIANSSLDLLEELQWSAPQFYLGKVDSFSGYSVAGYITQGNVRLVLVYDKSDDGSIRQFFYEVNELYVKCLMNPFYAVNQPLTSPDFDMKVKQVGRKYL
ncbi:trafficking protein particle complex subunit 20 [Diutina catenulata]